MDKLRQQYPEYNDLSDQQLADGFYKKHYSDMDRDVYDKKMGLSTEKSKLEPSIKEKTTFGGMTESELEEATEKEKRRHKAGLRGYGKFYTAGLSDELIGGAKAIKKKLYGDTFEEEKSFKELYKQERDIERDKDKALSKEFPITSGIGKIAGAIKSPVNILGEKIFKGISGGVKGVKAIAETTGKVAKAMKWAKTVGAGRALAGGAEGAITGYGLSENEETLKRDIAGSTAISAVLNVAIPMGFAAIKGGVKIAFPKTKMPKEAATRLIAKSVDVEKLPEIKKALQIATKEGRKTLAADVGGSNLQGLMRTVGKTKAGKNLIEEALEKRSADSSTRVVNSLRKNISEVDNYFGTLDDLTEQRKLLSKPLYEKAFKKKVPINRIKKFIDDDLVKKAYKEAIDTKVIDKNVPINSIEALNAVKKRLDGRIGRAIRAGDTTEVASLTKFKNSLVDELDIISPTYKEARKVSGDIFKMQDAMKKGNSDISKISPEKLKIDFNKLTDAQQDAYRIGVREKLENMAVNTSEGRNAALKLYNKPSMKKKLKIIIPSETQRKRFVKDMVDEFDFMKTKQKVLSGSRTDINLANNEEFINATTSIARRGGFKNVVGNLAYSMTEAIKKRHMGLDDSVARELTDILLDPNKSIDAMESIIKSQKGLQKELTRGAVMGIAPSLLITDYLIQNSEKQNGN